MASSAVLLTIVALGAAAGVAMRSEPELSPPRVVHRDPPGPAQIELAEAAQVEPAEAAQVEPADVDSPVAASAVSEPVALFGVDLAHAISVACGDTSDSDAFAPESVVCELAAQAAKRIPKAHSEFVSLLVPSG